MKKLITVILILGAVAAFSGCQGGRTAQPVQITRHIIDSDKGLIRDAIIKTGEANNWSMEEVAPDTIFATLRRREHFVAVKITYTDKSYKIDYVDSQNMLYNPKTGAIHKKYNKWIGTFDIRIHRKISELKQQTTKTTR